MVWITDLLGFQTVPRDVIGASTVTNIEIPSSYYSHRINTSAAPHLSIFRYVVYTAVVSDTLTVPQPGFGCYLALDTLQPDSGYYGHVKAGHRI